MPRKVTTRPGGRPIRVEALSISCGKESVIILTFDLVVIRYPSALPIRQKVAERLGCDPMRIIFSGTHCHSSWPEAEPAESEEAKKARLDFEAELERTFVDACVEAHGKMQPAEIACGRANLNGAISECRRTMLSNGTALNSWGMGPVAIPGVKFAGKTAAIDDSIDILAIRAPGADRPFAILTGYGSHIHLLPLPYFNGEVAGWVKSQIEARLPGVTALYSTHMAGDVSMKWIELPPVNGTEEQELAWHNSVGQTLAGRFVDAVMEQLPLAEYSRPTSIHHESHFIGTWEGKPPLVVVHSVVLGDVALVNVRPELFNSYGTQLRNRCPFRKLILLGYNESDFPYVGQPADHEQGSYEVNGALPRSEAEEEEFKKLGFLISPGRPEIGTQTVDHAVDMLVRIRTKIESTITAPAKT